MTAESRQRFRPPWQGRSNVQRDRYRTGQMTDAQYDLCWAALWRHRDPLGLDFEPPACRARHATAPYPFRSEYSDDGTHAVALTEWHALGQEAAHCDVCRRERLAVDVYGPVSAL